MWYQTEGNLKSNRIVKEFLKNMMAERRYEILNDSKSEIFCNLDFTEPKQIEHQIEARYMMSRI